MLVHHVVEEQRWAPPLFAGATIAEVGDRFAGDLLGADPVATLDEASRAALAAAEAPGALDRTVHLSFGDVDAAEYAMQLAADHLIHAWDLAVALGERPDARCRGGDGDPGLVRTGGAPLPRGGADRAQGAAARPRHPAATPHRHVREEAMTESAEHEALAAVAAFGRAFGTKDVDAIMATMTADCVFEDTGPPDGHRHVGAAAVRSAWTALFASSPDGDLHGRGVVRVREPGGATVALRLRRRARARHRRLHRPGWTRRREAVLRQGLTPASRPAGGDGHPAGRLMGTTASGSRACRGCTSPRSGRRRSPSRSGRRSCRCRPPGWR